jgi:hypothetical protein
MPEPKENQIKVQESRPPGPEEERWFDYSERLPFSSDEYLTRFADRLLTLNTAVLAAYLAALKLGSVSLCWPLLIPILLFLLSLLSSLYSIFPRSTRATSSDIFDVRDIYFEAIYWRSRALSFAFLTYFIGIVSGVAFTVWVLK